MSTSCLDQQALRYEDFNVTTDVALTGGSARLNLKRLGDVVGLDTLDHRQWWRSALRSRIPAAQSDTRHRCAHRGQCGHLSSNPGQVRSADVSAGTLVGTLLYFVPFNLGLIALSPEPRCRTGCGCWTGPFSSLPPPVASSAHRGGQRLDVCVWRTPLVSSPAGWQWSGGRVVRF